MCVYGWVDRAIQTGQIHTSKQVFGHLTDIATCVTTCTSGWNTNIPNLLDA